MMPVKISFFLILLLSFQTLKATESDPSKIHFTITTFNIRFYGLHGEQESRDPYLQKFLKDSIPASDIIMFEEIVDVPRVKKLLPADWDCLSYDNKNPGHQHVAVCHSPRFNFMREPTDNNDVIDEVAGEAGNLRPAVTAIVTNQEGKALFRMVAVHLKATPAYTKLRLEQSEFIASYLEKLKSSNLPVVIAGDFNTYKAPANHETENDTELILKTLNNSGMNFSHVANDLFTFRNSYGQGQFDQFYLSDKLTLLKPLQIFDICNAATTTGTELSDLAFYNQNISDHCPVSAEISL